MISTCNGQHGRGFVKMTSLNCQRCNSPLCPWDRDIEFRHWFPDESICTQRKWRRPKWIENQGKIKKKAFDRTRYFTVEMLKHNLLVRKGIKGLNPDLPCDTEKKRIKRWLAKHPGRAIKSSEEKKKFIEQMTGVGKDEKGVFEKTNKYECKGLTVPG